ncbi:D-2-hydroxyacid dehydrogenase family protein [Oceanicola sp. 502str15]|uniref:D-2-hydroxyacid dehydrogenase family protein n=1 Tax=Oceanicola sp. 502str15 TaxID=2696061 RepID=UPI0020958D45|nr:D-2-hydroxyacid dehydrogenase family protein [Oceanicola sp. 502str15]MCO6383033.1 D-2-hydroxyacid dehydrogenase family protein [Oceanicola sp. 502str15]
MSSLPVCAILDDYQNAALAVADWSALEGRVELRRFGAHLGGEEEVAAALQGVEVVVAMRERTPFPASLFARLPDLKQLITTGARNRSIDLEAARAHGVLVTHTRSAGNPAAELAWAGMLAALRNIPAEVQNFRDGGPWQQGLGRSADGKRLGILGLGKLGAKCARFGQAFGMKVAGWTRTDLPARAEALGIMPLPLEQLFETSDVVMIQMSLVPETRGFVTPELLALMKPDALLVNTSRGPIVDEPALIAALEAGRIGGAVLDVFGTEPLPQDHPFRRLTNVLPTPHIGYVTEENYRVYYADAVENIVAWLDGAPVRVMG